MKDFYAGSDLGWWLLKPQKRDGAAVTFLHTLHSSTSLFFVSLADNLSDFLPACLFVLRAPCAHPSHFHTRTQTLGESKNDFYWSVLWTGSKEKLVFISTIVLLWGGERKDSQSHSFTAHTPSIKAAWILNICVQVRACVYQGATVKYREKERFHLLSQQTFADWIREQKLSQMTRQ